MRSGLCGVIVSLSLATLSWAQAPGGGGFNQGGFQPGGPGAVGPGGPGTAGPPPNLMFSAIDVDGDGTITKGELRKAIVALRKLDADGDGNITLAEVSPMGALGADPAQMVERLMQYDKNADGLLTSDELPPGPMAQRMLQEGDQNGDQALDRDEITAAMEHLRNRFGAAAQVPGAMQGQAQQGRLRGGAGGANFDPQRMTGQMMRFDKNGDGKLSADEVPQQAQGMLRGADQNNDGVLDAGEVRATVERMGERFRGNMGRGARGGVRGQGDNGAQSGNPRGNP